MNKKNGGINDRDDDSGEKSGEQSHVDGNSGIDNRIDGRVLSDPPETMTAEEERQRRHGGLMPDKRNARVM